MQHSLGSAAVPTTLAVAIIDFLATSTRVVGTLGCFAWAAYQRRICNRFPYPLKLKMKKYLLLSLAAIEAAPQRSGGTADSAVQIFNIDLLLMLHLRRTVPKI